jgi:hypothetical protein
MLGRFAGASTRSRVFGFLAMAEELRWAIKIHFILLKRDP